MLLFLWPFWGSKLFDSGLIEGKKYFKICHRELWNSHETISTKMKYYVKSNVRNNLLERSTKGWLINWFWHQVASFFLRCTPMCAKYWHQNENWTEFSKKRQLTLREGGGKFPTNYWRYLLNRKFIFTLYPNFFLTPSPPPLLQNLIVCLQRPVIKIFRFLKKFWDHMIRCHRTIQE